MNDGASSSEMKVLVTGAAGFIGSALCARLLGDGHQVVGLDSYFAGARRNVWHLLRHDRFSMCHGDMVNPCFIDLGFDQIYDLDGSVNSAPLGFGSISSTSPLAFARRSGTGILQVAGDRRHDQSECDDPVVKRVRIFNAYGPLMSPGDDCAIANVVVKALKGEPIVIDGDGCQVRSFCFIDDIVEGLIRMMASPEDVVGPIDLGSSEACMILDLVNMIVEATGTRSEITFDPLASTGPRCRLPDLSVAKAQLGWSARMPVRIGLAETIDYFDELLSRDRDMPRVSEAMPYVLQSVVA